MSALQIQYFGPKSKWALLTYILTLPQIRGTIDEANWSLDKISKATKRVSLSEYIGRRRRWIKVRDSLY